MPDNAIKPQEDGSWQGEVLTDSAIAAFQREGKLHPRQIENLRNFNAAAKAKDGQTFMVWNHPATIARPGKRKAYGSLPATLREVAPAGVKITAQGNVLVSLLSVTQLMQNVETRAKSKRGMDLYDGNQLAILTDVQAVLDLHKLNQPTDGYFRDKYGPRAESHKRFINTIFGLMTKEQQSINPMFLEDSVNYSSNVYKTYRLDRISQSTRLQGGMKLPFSYEHVKANYFPNGAPINDIRFAEKSSIITPEQDAAYMQAVEAGDMEAARSAVDEAVRSAGYDLSHRRKSKRDHSKSKFVIQFADRESGRNWGYGEFEIVDKSLNFKKPSDDVVKFTEDYYGIDRESAIAELNPQDIVESAGAWDDVQFVSELWQAMENGLIPEQIGFKTPDGGVSIDPTRASMKSAETIIRRDDGSIVPLSERFGGTTP